VVPFLRSQPLLTLGAVLILTGMGVVLAMGRISDRNRHAWRAKARGPIRMRTNLSPRPSSPRVGAGTLW
jgi:hypothetical protein